MVIRLSLFISLLLSALFLLSAGCGGGGGGTGGVGSTTITVFGRIIWVENGGAPSPAATVRIGTASTTTNSADGGFALDVPSGTASLTVSTTVAGVPIIRTFTFPAAAASVDLGDLFIGPEEVSVTGRLISSSSGASIAGGTVSIAGRRATSAADGSFTISQVAYSSASQAVFLGLQGEGSATGFFTGFFSPPAAAVGGVVSVGNVPLVPTGGDSPPPLPYNLTVTCAPSGSGAAVEVLSGVTVIRTMTANSDGKATFWLPVGAYTVRAVKAPLTGSNPVTITSTSGQTSINVTLS